MEMHKYILKACTKSKLESLRSSAADIKKVFSKTDRTHNIGIILR